LCHLQHKLIGFYNRDEKCLQRGTDLAFKYSGLRSVFKRINTTVYYLYHILKLVLTKVLKDQKPANLLDVDAGFYINGRLWINLDLE
jgi:hypothetical protein